MEIILIIWTLYLNFVKVKIIKSITMIQLMSMIRSFFGIIFVSESSSKYKIKFHLEINKNKLNEENVKKVIYLVKKKFYHRYSN